MAFNRRKLIAGVGGRLEKLRKLLNFSFDQFSKRLGVSKSGYFKNEVGSNFPGLGTLYILQEDFNISMDWLIFNQGEMCLQKEQTEKAETNVEKKKNGAEAIHPDLQELLDYMEQDRLFKHEIFVYFFKYKKQQEQQKAVESPPESE
jgi:transcriptional regulator with XRE-family HTH domain